eukprot:8877570-Pyramimonas_sp.AAC.1
MARSSGHCMGSTARVNGLLLLFPPLQSSQHGGSNSCVGTDFARQHTAALMAGRRNTICCYHC